MNTTPVLFRRVAGGICTAGKGWTASPSPSADIKWRTSSPETALNFSAVGYYFAIELLKDPKLAGVPIGVIDSSVGGTTCEGWIPNDTLARFDAKDLHDSMFGIKPGMLYNAMIAPLGRLGLKGVVWYQGEGNANQPGTYAKFLTTSQAALAVAIGTNDGFNPKQNREIGRRLALLARRDAYQENLIPSGPSFKEAKMEGQAIRVIFDTKGDGLASSDGTVRGFALAGEDGQYRFADASIEGDSVIVKCGDISSPKSVRYAWAGVPSATLTNKTGLPAAPFRTDQQAPGGIEIQKQPVVRHLAAPGSSATGERIRSTSELPSPHWFKLIRAKTINPCD